MQTTRSSGPLSGIKVLDFSAYIAGPYGCTLLADMGAEVIKIEPPDGDNLRKYPSTLAAEGRAFIGVNRGKRAIVLDMKRKESQEAVLKLAETADVLVHNFRPGVPARLGIAYEQLRDAYPRLIYCSLTGYGDVGPLKDKAGYDQVLQAMTGIAKLQGRPRDPEIVYGSVVDYYAASMLALGVSSALFEREKTGRGQQVGVSLLRSALAMQSARFVWADGEPREIDRDMRSGGVTGLHPTKDGSLYISASATHFWQALCRILDLPDLAENPRYDSVRKRAQHVDEIIPRIHAALKARPAAEWEKLFGDEVPGCAARSVEDLFDHPQVTAQRMMTTFEHPAVGRYLGFARPVEFSETPCGDPRAAPVFGQHTEEVLLEAGLSRAQIDALRVPSAAALGTSS